MNTREIYFSNPIEKELEAKQFLVLRPEKKGHDEYFTLYDTVTEACEAIIEEKVFTHMQFPNNNEVLYHPKGWAVEISPVDEEHRRYFVDGIQELIQKQSPKI